MRTSTTWTRLAMNISGRKVIELSDDYTTFTPPTPRRRQLNGFVNTFHTSFENDAAVDMCVGDDEYLIVRNVGATPPRRRKMYTNTTPTNGCVSPSNPIAQQHLNTLQFEVAPFVHIIHTLSSYT
jgi:hypothetical protein